MNLRSLARAIVVVGVMMQPINSLRVAVLGSGVSGSVCARALAEKGVQVTVFEAGFGVGGRTSTRVTRGTRYQFDHGAQFIGRPKTNSFRQALDSWTKEGFVGGPTLKGRPFWSRRTSRRNDTLESRDFHRFAKTS